MCSDNFPTRQTDSRQAHERAAGKPSFAHTMPFEDIPGADGMRGAASRGFVTIVGPCGEHHTLSRSAAEALHRWLAVKLSRVPSYMEQEETKRYFAGAKAGEWISDALAKERAHG